MRQLREDIINKAYVFHKMAESYLWERNVPVEIEIEIDKALDSLIIRASGGDEEKVRQFLITVCHQTEPDINDLR
jgi:hypothetical protein